jgi:hypothetical protein
VTKPGTVQSLTVAIIVLLVPLWLIGCAHGPMAGGSKPSLTESKVFNLKVITPDKAIAFLSELDLGTVEVSPDGNAVTVTGPAEALGGISIGTFANPPPVEAHVRGIIDILGDSVVAIIPVRFQKDLAILIEAGPSALRQARRDTKPPTPVAPEPTLPQTVQPVVETQTRQEGPIVVAADKTGQSKPSDVPAEAVVSQTVQPMAAHTDLSVEGQEKAASSQASSRPQRIPDKTPIPSIDTPILANGGTCWNWNYRSIWR